MATAIISEYRNMITDESGRIVPVAEEPSTTQTVTFTTSTQSAALQDTTKFVRIIADAKAHFVFGTNPTATANSAYIPADYPEYFGLPEGQSYEIAFYDGTS